MRLLIAHLLIVITTIASAQPEPYKFIVAGHAYGNPGGTNFGLYPPFINFFDDINAMEDVEQVILLGDVVRFSTVQHWDSFEAQIEELIPEVLLAPGNHDTGKEFEERFGDYFFSKLHKNNLYLFLTPSRDDWNIIGEQRDFMESEIQKHKGNIDNIFMFIHELIWFDTTTFFKNVQINFAPNYPGRTNFHDEIMPYFLGLNKPVYVFAGDVCATHEASSHFYYREGEVRLIATGMGDYKRDNLIIVSVNGEDVELDLKTYNQGNKKALGRLEDYALMNEIDVIEIPFLVPNPARDYVRVVNQKFKDFTLKIYASNGKLMSVVPINYNSHEIIPLENFDNGTYIFQFVHAKGVGMRKLIVINS